MTRGLPALSAQDASYRWLKDRILTTPRHEGLFLTEGEVAAAAGTSRTPVREALLRLEAEGFLQRLPKKGAYVPPISDSEVEWVMQARRMLETWCIREVAASEPADVAALMDELIDQQRTLIHDPLDFIDCDRRFHRTFVHAAGNPVLANFYESLRDRQLRSGVYAVTVSEGRANQVIDEHAAIVEALRTGDAGLTETALTRHLTNTLGVMRGAGHLPAALGSPRTH
jgi:DNA-binding GntR family transcriptional regulator